MPHVEVAAHSLEQWFDGSLSDASKRFEKAMLERLFYPLYPSSRQLAVRLGVSHTAVANKLREYGIGRKAHSDECGLGERMRVSEEARVSGLR